MVDELEYRSCYSTMCVQRRTIQRADGRRQHGASGRDNTKANLIWNLLSPPLGRDTV